MVTKRGGKGIPLSRMIEILKAELEISLEDNDLERASILTVQLALINHMLDELVEKGADKEKIIVAKKAFEGVL